MKFTLLSAIAAAFSASTVLANTPIPLSFFTENNGTAAAEAAAPMWHLVSGSCMPSAAEDGKGDQTNGVAGDLCGLLGALNEGCPQQPTSQGANTAYENIPGEPFQPWVPTYYNVQQCTADNSWRVVYYVYFKKDTGHESDWEGAVVIFNEDPDNEDMWIRGSIKLEQDGNHPQTNWTDINSTFDSSSDMFQDNIKNGDFPKLYFGKWHHPVHLDMTPNDPDICPITSDLDFRSNDYQFWSLNNLRSSSFLNPTWDWGQATGPANIDACTF